MALIEIEHLKKYFPTARGMVHAVDGVTFQIEEGTTLGLVGESGCGKSTLGRTLIHLLDSTDGTIRFRGEDVTHPDRKKLRALREDMQIIFLPGPQNDRCRHHYGAAAAVRPVQSEDGPG